MYVYMSSIFFISSILSLSLSLYIYIYIILSHTLSLFSLSIYIIYLFFLGGGGIFSFFFSLFSLLSSLVSLLFSLFLSSRTHKHSLYLSIPALSLSLSLYLSLSLSLFSHPLHAGDGACDCQAPRHQVQPHGRTECTEVLRRAGRGSGHIHQMKTAHQETHQDYISILPLLITSAWDFPSCLQDYTNLIAALRIRPLGYHIFEPFCARSCVCRVATLQIRYQTLCVSFRLEDSCSPCSCPPPRALLANIPGSTGPHSKGGTRALS